MEAEYQSHHGTSQLRPPSQPQSRRPYWRQFCIPTSAVSLSSGFEYDSRLQQLFVTPSEWKEFTNDIVDCAKLSFGENKMAWGAGLATGTAGTFALLFLGPMAGYYAGKAVHKRTVVEKVRERLLEDGTMSNVLRRWNERAWAKRGFHTLLELPGEEVNVRNRADAERFRIVVIPGSVVIRQFPMSSQIDTAVQMELQGEVLFRRREVSLQRPTQQLPSHHQPPPLPARVPSIQNLPGNPLYEMPITQAPTVSELPYTQAGTGELVHYYEMDGESVRR